MIVVLNKRGWSQIWEDLGFPEFKLIIEKLIRYPGMCPKVRLVTAARKDHRQSRYVQGRIAVKFTGSIAIVFRFASRIVGDILSRFYGKLRLHFLFANGYFSGVLEVLFGPRESESCQRKFLKFTTLHNPN